MQSFYESGKPRTVARVQAIKDDGRTLYLELRNGRVIPVFSEEPIHIVGEGSIVLFDEEEQNIAVAPDELWSEESWIGIVHLILDNDLIVDRNGSWQVVPKPADFAVQQGNSLEITASLKVNRIVSKTPLKYLDPPSPDDDIISTFKTEREALKATFEDFGGLHEVVERARQLIEVPLAYKERLANIGTRPIKGVLFTGPPGTGKTMLAKIIASYAESSFYEINGPEIFSKWYGESERILRDLFKDAAEQRRSIIFFDEIDSVAGQRAEESHEASRRVVAQLLTLMDGFSSASNVIVIAATNRPQDIDDALRRPGRFDWEINFHLPELSDREAILESSARTLKTDGELPYKWVAQQTDSWSAAELTAIWNEAALFAVTDGREVIRADDFVGGFQRVQQQRQRLGYKPSSNEA